MTVAQNRISIVDARRSEYLKDEFFKQNFGLVYSIVNKLKNIPMDEAERISLGTFGLLKAFNTYDEKFGFTFGTYATRCITNEILQEDRRVSNKFNNTTLSLDYKVESNKDGTELLFIETLTKQDEDFNMDDFQSVIKVYKRFVEVYSKKEPRMVEAFNMYIFQDITTAEIARKFGLMTQSAGSRLASRSVKAIQEIAIEMEVIEDFNKFYKHKSSGDSKLVKDKDNALKTKALYVISNYSDLSAQDISNITGLTLMKVAQLKANLTKGKINLTPDSSIKPIADKYLEDKLLGVK